MCLFDHFLPARHIRYNGVPVPRGNPGHVPWRTRSESKPAYEQALIDAIEANVKTGNHATIIGGGYGVSAVIAAECAGNTGHVVCIEAAGEAVTRARETVAMNDVEDLVTVRHAVVGTAGETRGDDLGGHASFAALDPADVLVIDVDGAELALLEAVNRGTWQPQTLIVEHHATPDGTSYRPGAVQDAITDAGYHTLRTRSRSIPPAFGGEESVFVAERTENGDTVGV